MSTPSADTLLQRAREKRRAENTWSATVVHADRVVVSVDGNGEYDVGTRAQSLAKGPRRVVVPVLEKLLVGS
jgi:hypothetical protein